MSNETKSRLVDAGLWIFLGALVLQAWARTHGW